MSVEIRTIEDVVARKGGAVTILDGGAGKGWFRYADFPACRIVALDLKRITGMDDPPNVERVVGNLEELPFADDEFDLVLLNFVLEHTLEPEKVLGEISRVLKHDGELYVSVPNADSVEDRLFRFAYRLRHPSTFFRYSPDYHHQKYTLESLRRFLGEFGFNISCLYTIPGGYTWMPPGFRNPFLLLCRSLGIRPTRVGNMIAWAERGEVEEKIYTIGFVCSNCGLPVDEVSPSKGRWVCLRCGGDNIYFPP